MTFSVNFIVGEIDTKGHYTAYMTAKSESSKKNFIWALDVEIYKIYLLISFSTLFSFLAYK